MNLSASPMPVTLAGKEYLITPLSDQASQAITMWLRGGLMASAYLGREKVQSAGEDPEKFAKLIINAAMTIEWLDENASRLIQTTSGMARILLESIKPTEPRITQQKCIELLRDPADEELFWVTFLAVNDLYVVDDNEKKK